MFALVVTCCLWLFLRQLALGRGRTAFLATVGILILLLMAAVHHWNVTEEVGNRYLAGLLVCSSIVLELLLRRQSLGRERDVIRDEVQRRALSETEPELIRSQYDCFLSYKSEDVHLVRFVAEQLIAYGHFPWFAEYVILLTGRSQFEAVIADGTRKAKYGICFTNDLYAKSPHCASEREQLAGPEGCGKEHLLQVRVPGPSPDALVIEETAGVPTFNHTGDSWDAAQWIARMIGCDEGTLAEPDGPTQSQEMFEVSSLGCRFNVAGWKTQEPRIERKQGDVWCPVFERQHGQYLAQWNLIVGSKSISPRPLPAAGAAIDDRECFDATVAFAQSHLRMRQIDCKGAHLYFVNDYSHLALTYSDHGAWYRKYSIVLPVSRVGGSREFAFSYTFFGPFREFCRYVYLMDRTVCSLEVG